MTFKPRRWTLVLLVPVALLAAAVGIHGVTPRPFGPHELPAAALLEESLSQWTATAGTPKAAVIERRLGATDAQQLLGPSVTEPLLAMLAKGLAAAQSKPETRRTVAVEFTQSQVVLNQALVQKKLPLFVDGSFLPTGTGLAPLIMTYYVEQDELFEFGGQPLRAVSAWRMDPMRIRLPALGYVREGNPVAIISYDLLETMLILHLLPSMVENEPAFVFDETTRFQGDPQVIAIEARLGRVLREHFHAQRLGSSAQKLGELLAQRRNLVAKWRRTITGFPISPPERFLPERDLGTKLEPLISRTEAASWARLCSELAEPEVVTAFEQQRSAWANAVKRHELQHLIDQKDGLSGIPVALAHRLVVDPATEPEPYTLFGAARSELSAFLAEVGDGPYPRLSLVQLATAVFDHNLRSTPHHFAALALFDGLMKSLGVTADHPTHKEAVVRVIEADPAASQARAALLYEEWFGRALSTAVRIKSVENAHWRH